MNVVCINLVGGNDGLNTVIPLDKLDVYINKRRELSIRNSLVLSDTVGLHPAMAAMLEMYKEGNLGIVQAVGYTNTDLSHFRSTDIWMSASRADEKWEHGVWGRAAEQLIEIPGVPKAIKIGSVAALGLKGEFEDKSMVIQDPTSFYDFVDDIPIVAPDTEGGKELIFVDKLMKQTEQYSLSVREAALRVTNQLAYPNTSLAAQLKIVARLIAGGLDCKIFMVSLGGFDTHDRQVNTGDASTGVHAYLLGELSEALAAFQKDCAHLGIWKDICGMTFSEFGRRVSPNASFGTDHGMGGPVFYFGGNLSGTRLHGTSAQFVEDNVEVQYNFKKVYSAFVQQLGADITQALKEAVVPLPMFDLSTPPPAGLIETILDYPDGRYKWELYKDGTGRKIQY